MPEQPIPPFVSHRIVERGLGRRWFDRRPFEAGLRRFPRAWRFGSSLHLSGRSLGFGGCAGSLCLGFQSCFLSGRLFGERLARFQGTGGLSYRFLAGPERSFLARRRLTSHPETSEAAAQCFGQAQDRGERNSNLDKPLAE